MIDKFLEVHVTTIAQYNFELEVLSTPSKIVEGAGAPQHPLFRRLCNKLQRFIGVVSTVLL